MRSLVTGNGHLYVAFDGNLNIRDLYFPHVGEENHVYGHHCRVGVWVDGVFSWLGGGWDKKLEYRDEALVTQAHFTNQELGVEIVFNDTVHYLKNLLLRRVTVKNLREHPCLVRLFFTHDLLLLETHIADTAMYHPKTRSIIHYKRNRYFLINARDNKGGGFYQYATGVAEFRGAEGTWRDAEDGELSNNPIAQGSVDSTVSIQLEVDHTATAYYWIAAGTSLEDVLTLNQYVLEKSPDTLISHTENYHRAWVNNAGINFTGLPVDIVELFKRCLLILRVQMNHNGAIIAANDSDIMEFNRDHYSYMWPRDGALVTYGLSLVGHREASSHFFQFCSSIISPEGYFHHKYNPDGSIASSWHPQVGEDGSVQLPIQEDETALVLYSLWEHYRQHRNIEFIETLYEPLIKKAADFLNSYRHPVYQLPLDSYDLWEEQRGVFTFTTATVYAGLMAAASFASLFSDPSSEEKYRKAAEEVRQAALKHLYDEKAQRFVKK